MVLVFYYGSPDNLNVMVGGHTSIPIGSYVEEGSLPPTLPRADKTPSPSLMTQAQTLYFETYQFPASGPTYCFTMALPSSLSVLSY